MIKERTLNRFFSFVLGTVFFVLNVISVCLAGDNYKFWGDFVGGIVCDDNIYKDSTGYRDVGHELSFDLGLRSKFSGNTFSRLQYRLESKEFDKYNLENQNNHFFDGLVKHGINDFFSLEFNGGIEFCRLPNADIYNSRLIYGNPKFRLYIFDRTVFMGGVICERNYYPDYNLDYEGEGGVIKIGQEFSLYTYLECLALVQVRDYFESRLYGIDGKIDYNVTGGLQTLTDLMRKDRLKNMEIRLFQEITDEISIELINQYEKLDSNCNYFDWGPNQWEEQNTVGDERLIEDYYSYWHNKFCGNIKIFLRRDFYLELGGSYMDKRYNGRLAKDKNENFLFPEQKRQDKQIVVLTNLTKEVFKNSPLGNMEIKLEYSYESNQSNDALYDYCNNIISIFFINWF